MSPKSQPLPMAPTGCELDDQQLAAQLARYRQLSATVLTVRRDSFSARVRFTGRLDTGLLKDTLAIERGCCGFFALEYDPSARVLSISTEPDRLDALSTLLSALTSPDNMSPTSIPSIGTVDDTVGPR